MVQSACDDVARNIRQSLPSGDWHVRVTAKSHASVTVAASEERWAAAAVAEAVLPWNAASAAAT